MPRRREDICVPEKTHYSFVIQDDSIELGINHHAILLRDCLPSSRRGCLTSSKLSKNCVMNLVEQNIEDDDELPTKNGNGKPKNFEECYVLFLQKNGLSSIGSSFFDIMPNLSFLDLSDTRLKILPSSIFRLSKLKVLLLRNCIYLEELPSEIEKLDQLEVFDLSGTQLYYLPDQIRALTCLKHLQLSLYGHGDELEDTRLPSEPLICDGALSKLKALEALSINVHIEDLRWRNIAWDVMKEVACLERLVSLDFYFPDLEDFEEFILTSDSLKERGYFRKFKFIVGQSVTRIAKRVPDEVEAMFDEQEMYLRFVNGENIFLDVRSVLRHATAFYLDHHAEIKSLSEFGVSNLGESKLCLVRHCSKIQNILGDGAEGAFPSLQHLWLYSLRELEYICGTRRQGENFKALKHLTLHYCPKLKFIFQESMVQCVSNLEELVVVDCESLEKIIEDDQLEMEVGYNAPRVLTKMKKLVLRTLPNLVSLGNGFRPSKVIMSIHSCPNLILNNGPKLIGNDCTTLVQNGKVKKGKFRGLLCGCWI